MAGANGGEIVVVQWRGKGPNLHSPEERFLRFVALLEFGESFPQVLKRTPLPDMGEVRQVARERHRQSLRADD